MVCVVTLRGLLEVRLQFVFRLQTLSSDMFFTKYVLLGFEDKDKASVRVQRYIMCCWSCHGVLWQFRAVLPYLVNGLHINNCLAFNIFHHSPERSHLAL